uniref:Uncharacterized protein n=1 Tax=Chromera velia CCMP2878 TaxID=1169474 RepID=A0A0G4G4Y5_9ALVE|mmetsp:Transcript_9949/g.19302  ORF Transcript_9949/g.19302 Transcript_9949/m.19302 type:complete len:233 (-) Transcript_9949:548-1246(-)|eukprot:Cvel_4181.t1-p1 / transcript=Cvel_4181.t1 / gene=Cvel_4181 / organism=Chromera_velia_CCMP2878 / gene_product=hypothetical protein / transcript_product=hypothetical protein / location=Cvel_scaffold180:54992-56179(+) / protein_length=232 / sequence_SO=supercontig / SO=protein_coding / is_pseudo=false
MSRQLRGPERFFYDRSTYTGSHRRGGPTTRGNGITDEKISLANLCDRSPYDVRGVKPSDYEKYSFGGRELTAHTAFYEPDKPKPGGGYCPTQAIRGTSVGPSKRGGAGTGTHLTRGRAASPSPSPAVGRRRASQRDCFDATDFDFLDETDQYSSLPPVSPSSMRRSITPTPARSSVRGPERFFYDRSTYTGVHNHGGPSTKGNGLPYRGGGGRVTLDSLCDRSPANVRGIKM